VVNIVVKVKSAFEHSFQRFADHRVKEGFLEFNFGQYADCFLVWSVLQVAEKSKNTDFWFTFEDLFEDKVLRKSGVS
jgi:hypothetical protein